MQSPQQVIFTIVSHENLDTIPITPGTIIALRDRSGVYYDAWDGSGNTDGVRYMLSSVAFVRSLPEVGSEGVLYILDPQGTASTRRPGAYMWRSGAGEGGGAYVRSTLVGMEDVPVDGVAYLRKDREWLPLQFMYICNGQDDTQLGDLIQSMLESYDHTSIDVAGSFACGEGDGIVVNMPEGGKSLNLDFSKVSSFSLGITVPSLLTFNHVEGSYARVSGLVAYANCPILRCNGDGSTEVDGLVVKATKCAGPVVEVQSKGNLSLSHSYFNMSGASVPAVHVCVPTHTRQIRIHGSTFRSASSGSSQVAVLVEGQDADPMEYVSINDNIFEFCGVASKQAGKTTILDAAFNNVSLT